MTTSLSTWSRNRTIWTLICIRISCTVVMGSFVEYIQRIPDVSIPNTVTTLKYNYNVELNRNILYIIKCTVIYGSIIFNNNIHNNISHVTYIQNNTIILKITIFCLYSLLFCENIHILYIIDFITELVIYLIVNCFIYYID